MTKKDLIEEAIHTLYQLDEERLKRVNKLLHNILQDSDDALLSLNASLIAERSGALSFLNEEPDLYNDSDSLIQLR